MQLPSKYQIGDEVTYKDYFMNQPKAGVIIAIRFTKATIFYDICHEEGGVASGLTEEKINVQEPKKDTQLVEQQPDGLPF